MIGFQKLPPTGRFQIVHTNRSARCNAVVVESGPCSTYPERPFPICDEILEDVSRVRDFLRTPAELVADDVKLVRRSLQGQLDQSPLSTNTEEPTRLARNSEAATSGFTSESAAR